MRCWGEFGFTVPWPRGEFFWAGIRCRHRPPPPQRQPPHKITTPRLGPVPVGRTQQALRTDDDEARRRCGLGPGREVLSYIEGRDQGAPFIPEILADDGAERLGQLAGRLRTALLGYPCPPDARWQFTAGPPGPGQAVQHGDLGPWNLLWGDDGEIAGVLDWELTGPASPSYDTGHLAWFTIPLMDDARARARGFPRPPGRQARMHAFARGTGLPVSQVLGAALEAQQEYARRIITGQAEPWTTFQMLGLHKNAAADGRWTRIHFSDELAQ